MEEKHAVWQPIGHRIGFCKHPDSVDYKCSLCGHEIYTLYDLGFLEICPNCGARMDGEAK